MVLIFPIQLAVVFFGTLVSILIWKFSLTRSIIDGTSFSLLFNGLLLLFGTWLWLYLALPNYVSIYWYFLQLNIALGFNALLVVIMRSSESEDPSIEVLRKFTLIFGISVAPLFLDKVLVIFPAIVLFLGLTTDSQFYSMVKAIMTSSYTPEESSTSSSIRIKEIPPLGKQVGVAVIFIILIPILTGFNLFFFHDVDRAVYFDNQITTSPSDLPFTSKIDGDMLRVVDKELAYSIMVKSNRLGSNTMVTEVHLGNINGSTYWIGGVLFDGNKFIRQDLNHFQGFIAVDFRDPELTPIIIEENFYVGRELVLNNNLNRIVYDYNPNYIVGDNTYFTMADDHKMRLIAPYSIQAAPLFQDFPSDAGVVTEELQLKGGVLEITSDGKITDYQDLSKLPPYARVQYYSETWLEYMVRSWGNSITQISPERKFGVFTSKGGIFKSPWKMGIDDDVRVVIDPSTRHNVQYVLLESTGSTNQVLRGALKGNESGIYFYDWSEFGFIDSTAAKHFADTEVTNTLQTTTHGYETLLPLLYPIRENPTSLADYAYVVVLQFKGVRFGGIVIVDPTDKTGSHTAVTIADSTGKDNITKIVDQTIELYFAGSEKKVNGTFEVTSVNSYVDGGYSVYVMEGNFTADNQTSFITVVFRQDHISELEDWIVVVTTKVGDRLLLTLDLEGKIYYAITVSKG